MTQQKIPSQTLRTTGDNFSGDTVGFSTLLSARQNTHHVKTAKLRSAESFQPQGTESFHNVDKLRLISILNADVANLVISFISLYARGELVWSYYYDPAFGIPELRKARIVGFDRFHGLYLISWLDASGRRDNVERTADYIFPCGKDSEELSVGESVWAEHEFGPCRMFEAIIISQTDDSFVIQPSDSANCFGTTSTIRSRDQLLKLEPLPQLHVGDICWAEKIGPMKTSSQIFRAEVVSFSPKEQMYTVRWRDTFGSGVPFSVLTRFQVMLSMTDDISRTSRTDHSWTVPHSKHHNCNTPCGFLDLDGIFHPALHSLAPCRDLDRTFEIFKSWLTCA